MNIFKLKYRRSGVSQTIELNALERYEDKNIILEFSSMAAELGNRISVVLRPKAPVVVDECSFKFDMIYEYKTITTNGYQSSSESLESDYNFKLYKLNFVAKLFSIANFGDYKTEKIFENKGLLSHTFIQFNKEDGKNIRFYGSVNEENAYTIFNFDKEKNSMCIYSDCKNRLVDDNFSLLDFIIAEGEPHKIYDNYVDYFTVNKPSGKGKNIWVTPHKISHKIKPITQSELEKNISQIKANRLPVNTILINDSYQTRLGDFNIIDEKRFPDGMKAAADAIKENGFEAGIWIAPFVAEKKSKLYKEHPDWFLKKVMKFNVSGGYNPDWSSKFFVLDIYNDEVAAYINDMFKTIMYEWGFELIYIDLIYAAAIEPRIDRTRAEIISDITNFITKLCMGRTIIASSLPIGSAMGKYDYCKISVDNAPFWEDNVMKKAGYKERVSTLNALNTVIARRYFNENIFKNVSTSFFIGSEDTHLNLLEKHSIITLNSILSSCTLVSDNISSYDDLEMPLLKKAFPNPEIKNVLHKETDGIHTFEFAKNTNHYLVIFNPKSKDSEYTIQQGIYCGKYGALLASNSALTVKAHQTQVLVRVDVKKQIQPIYSEAHLLPLFEIDKIKHDNESSVEITFNKDIKELGPIYIIAPNDTLTVNGENCKLVQNYGKRSIFIFENEKNKYYNNMSIVKYTENTVQAADNADGRRRRK
ncbi:MAG: hypothetical protein GYA50_03045 [Eubacteriaceae bacterium]|nr:hypothetical protein [Eubacteriaceae bacterium]